MLQIKYIMFCVLLGGVTLNALAGERPPNILFIVADDLGWADTNSYGSTFHETPNISRLERDGMMLKNFHSTSPVCSPARASLMTGLYAERLGMIQPACHIERIDLQASLPPVGWPHKKVIAPRGTTRLDTVFPTYAKVLRDNGYLTAHYGKWHLGEAPYSPLEHGFKIDVPHTKSHGPKGSYFGPKQYGDSFTLKPGEHLEDRMADEAVKFIHENKDRPFLLNYWAFSVHSPYFAKEELLEKYRAKAKRFPADAPQRNPIYAGMVETFDTNVGRLLDALEEAGIADNTIIVLTSDNGGTVRSGYKEEAYWGNGTK
ncbi:MAG: sulfatase-like hydrolase/transferase, partial [Coraliomargarita sp.]